MNYTIDDYGESLELTVYTARCHIALEITAAGAIVIDALEGGCPLPLTVYTPAGPIALEVTAAGEVYVDAYIRPPAASTQRARPVRSVATRRRQGAFGCVEDRRRGVLE